MQWKTNLFVEFIEFCAQDLSQNLTTKHKKTVSEIETAYFISFTLIIY